MRGFYKTSISLDPDLAERAEQRAAALGFSTSFSAYVAKLIADDLAGAGPMHPTPPRPRSGKTKFLRKSDTSPPP
jgi:hypothetical protein